MWLKKRPSRSDSFREEFDDSSKDLKGQREFQTSDLSFYTLKPMFSMFSMRLKKDLRGLTVFDEKSMKQKKTVKVRKSFRLLT